MIYHIIHIILSWVENFKYFKILIILLLKLIKFKFFIFKIRMFNTDLILYTYIIWILRYLGFCYPLLFRYTCIFLSLIKYVIKRKYHTLYFLKNIGMCKTVNELNYSEIAVHFLLPSSPPPLLNTEWPKYTN